MTPDDGNDPYCGWVSVAVPRPAVGDVVLAAALVTLGQLTTWLRLDSAEAFVGDRWLNAAVLVLGLLPVIWLRLAPLATAATSAAVLCLPHAVAALDVTVLGQFLPLVVVTAYAGYHASARTAPVVAGCAVVGMLVVSLNTPVLRTPTSIVFNLLVLLAPWAAARALRRREERARRLGAALAHERTRFEDRMAEAVERERAQIARDLHDIVAHGVSVMVVQIGGARMQWAEDPDRAGCSLLEAEEAGRQALTDLRRMLRVLRESPASSGTEPRPGLRDLEMLVHQASRAGIDVRVGTTGDLDALPPAIDISAYRIVQESLTNVIKHSDARRADLTLDVTDGQLSLVVHDGGPARRVGEQERDHAGHGVVGIRERVAFFNGESRVGPLESGGWRVAVAIPVSGHIRHTAGMRGTPA